MPIDYRPALDLAIMTAAEAAVLLLAESARPNGPRGPRGHCPADDEAELLIRERLLTAFPTWGYLGEETGGQVGAPGEPHVWLVDPNDGTSAMQRGFRGNAVAIGLLRDGVPVLGVVQAVTAPDDDGDRFAWAEGCGPLTRNDLPVVRPPWPETLSPNDVVVVSQDAAAHPLGNLQVLAPARFLASASIAYRLALAAVGEGAAVVSLAGPWAWDYGAGHALLRASGGTLVDQDGAEVRYGPDGGSSTRACFGGGLALARDLARRDWSPVWGGGFGRTAPPTGLEPARLRPGVRVADSALLNRAQGCLLGQLAGDALGALVEFESADSIARTYPSGGPRELADGGPHRIMAGQPTDDSELALMLARTLARDGAFDQEAVAASYASWYQGWDENQDSTTERWRWPFDVGTTTSQALGEISTETVRNGTAASAAEAAASRSSQANGALMRVSPLGIWGARRDPDGLANAARADARLTHPHPVCQEASALFVVTLAHAIREGTDPEATYAFARAWAEQFGRDPTVRDALAAAEQTRPADFQTLQGWVLIALQEAFYQLIHAGSLEDGVVATVRAGGDTDTNAAICGALLGAVHGRRGIPDQWRRMILTCRPLPGYGPIKQPRPAIYWPTDALELAELLVGN